MVFYQHSSDPYYSPPHLRPGSEVRLMDLSISSLID